MFIFLGKIPILTDISNISNIFQMFVNVHPDLWGYDQKNTELKRVESHPL